MTKVKNWVWAEAVLLICLFIAFIAGALDTKTYAYLAIGLLAVFALPAFLDLASARSSQTDGD